MIGSRQEGVMNGNSWLTKPITLCDQKAGLVDEGRAMDIECLDFSKAFDIVFCHILIGKLLSTD